MIAAFRVITIGDVAGATRADWYKYWTQSVISSARAVTAPRQVKSSTNINLTKHVFIKDSFRVQFSGELVGFDARDSTLMRAILKVVIQ
jgi:hypothetical protein